MTITNALTEKLEEIAEESDRAKIMLKTKVAMTAYCIKSFHEIFNELKRMLIKMKTSRHTKTRSRRNR